MALLLACGHSLSDVIEQDGEQVCGACQDEADEALEGEVIEQNGAHSDPPEPVYGTRGDAPGPKGCWAVKADGTPCGAPKAKASEWYCGAHLGRGLAADPARYSPLGHDARRRQLQARAHMRLLLGDSGRVTPRSALRAAVIGSVEPLVGRAVSAALDPNVPAERGGRLALDLIREVDPAQHVDVEVSGDMSTDQMLARLHKGVSVAELRVLAKAVGLEMDEPETANSPAKPELTPPQTAQPSQSEAD